MAHRCLLLVPPLPSPHTCGMSYARALATLILLAGMPSPWASLPDSQWVPSFVSGLLHLLFPLLVQSSATFQTCLILHFPWVKSPLPGSPCTDSRMKIAGYSVDVAPHYATFTSPQIHRQLYCSAQWDQFSLVPDSPAPRQVGAQVWSGGWLNCTPSRQVPRKSYHDIPPTRPSQKVGPEPQSAKV